MYCTFTLFTLQLLNKSDLEVLEFRNFSELAILDWYLTRHIKHARILVLTNFQWNIYCLMLFQLKIMYIPCIKYHDPYVAQNLPLKSHYIHITYVEVKLSGWQIKYSPVNFEVKIYSYNCLKYNPVHYKVKTNK